MTSLSDLTPGSPKRVQLRRTKGYRKPTDAVVVARPSKWGNPFVVHEHSDRCGDDLWSCPLTEDQYPAASRFDATRRFRHALLLPTSSDPWVPDIDDIRYELRGKDLACWCPLDEPCHADVLLEIANADG